MPIDIAAPTPTADPIPAFAPVESPLACGMGVSVGVNIRVVVVVVCEEPGEDVEEDAGEDDEEGLRVLVVEVGPIVSGILIAAEVSQQSVFDCPQHQVVACSASLSQGVTGALLLTS
ncbi:hypothetical protein VE04_02809 [Pseudogymnoascus sp. 24MN13]|nr:hypothetical protein VE04_02809 [Pseudogymnoascus sp. 24MN13]